MNPNELDLVVKYLVSRLDPQGQEDVKEILGGNLPDPAQDALTKGGFAMRWPKRLRNRAMLAEKDRPTLAADAKPETEAERIARILPHNGRLK